MADDHYPRPGEQVTGLPAGVKNDFLSLPIPGAQYGAGDAVPTVALTYGTRASGLIVPLKYTRPPVPLDSVATYLTGRDVVGIRIPHEVMVDHLARLPLLGVLQACATLLGLIDRPGHTQADVDATLMADFTPPARQRIAALLATGERVLVAPRVLLELVKNAARYSGDCLLPEVTPGLFLCALLGTGDDLERQAILSDAIEGDDDLVVGTGVPGRLEREVVAIHHFHRQIENAHVLARFIRRWTQLPAELRGHPDVVDLPAEFHAAVGVRLNDFITAGVLLHSAAIGSGPAVRRDALSRMDLDDGAAERILALVARTPTDLRAWARGSSSRSTWEFSYLEQFPVLDCGEHLLVLRPDLVVQRFFGWLPLFDIEAGLGTGAPARKQLARIKGCMEHLGEVYARETFRAQARRHGLRLFEESKLRAALSPQPGLKISDVTLDDGRRWAVFEVTSSRLTRPSVASTSAERLDEDFTKLVVKVRQLDDTITSLRVRETALTGQPISSPRRRYFPVLVLTEGFPVNPVTMTMLRQRAQEAGLLRGDDVAELEVVDGVELEMIEGAAFGEATVLDALEAKSRASLYRANMRDFLLREHHFVTRTPQRVRQLAQLAYDIALRAAPHPSTTDAA